jgi:hypothetical protein
MEESSGLHPPQPSIGNLTFSYHSVQYNLAGKLKYTFQSTATVSVHYRPRSKIEGWEWENLVQF